MDRAVGPTVKNDPYTDKARPDTNARQCETLRRYKGSVSVKIRRLLPQHTRATLQRNQAVHNLLSKQTASVSTVLWWMQFTVPYSEAPITQSNRNSKQDLSQFTTKGHSASYEYHYIWITTSSHNMRT